MSKIDTMIENTSDEVRMDLRVVRSASSWLACDEDMKYQAFSHILARSFFAPLSKNGNDLMAADVAAFTKKYFCSIPLSKINWHDMTGCDIVREGDKIDDAEPPGLI